MQLDWNFYVVTSGQGGMLLCVCVCERVIVWADVKVHMKISAEMVSSRKTKISNAS